MADLRGCFRTFFRAFPAEAKSGFSTRNADEWNRSPLPTSIPYPLSSSRSDTRLLALFNNCANFGMGKKRLQPQQLKGTHEKSLLREHAHPS